MLLTIASSAPPKDAGGGQVAIAGSAQLSVAAGVRQPVIVGAAILSPYGSVREALSFTLWPGGAPVSLPDPGTGNVWVVSAVTQSRLEALTVTSTLVIAGVFGIAGWQVGAWIGDAIARHRAPRYAMPR